MPSPLISVVIPTYNEEKYLPDILRSIKRQTYKKYEVIVVDYNSKDKTRQIAKRFGCKVISIDRPGVSAAKNKGFRHAKGSIVAFIDADYILSKNLFERVVKEFQADKSVVLIEPTLKLNLKGVSLVDRKIWKFMVRFMNFYKSLSFSTLNPRAYGCVFVKRWAVVAAGGFNEELNLAEDLELFSKIRKYGSFKMIKTTARISLRRYIKQGLLRTFIQYGLSNLLLLLFRKVKLKLNPVR
jgi:glycosyltransferase involved in cell wall biosynthesis